MGPKSISEEKLRWRKVNARLNTRPQQMIASLTTVMRRASGKKRSCGWIHSSKQSRKHEMFRGLVAKGRSRKSHFCAAVEPTLLRGLCKANMWGLGN